MSEHNLSFSFHTHSHGSSSDLRRLLTSGEVAEDELYYELLEYRRSLITYLADDYSFPPVGQAVSRHRTDQSPLGVSTGGVRDDSMEYEGFSRGPKTQGVFGAVPSDQLPSLLSDKISERRTWGLLREGVWVGIDIIYQGPKPVRCVLRCFTSAREMCLWAKISPVKVYQHVTGQVFVWESNARSKLRTVENVIDEIRFVEDIISLHGKK